MRAKAEASLAGIDRWRWYSPAVDQHPAFAHIAQLPAPAAHEVGQRLLGIPFHMGLTQRDRLRVVQALQKVAPQDSSSEARIALPMRAEPKAFGRSLISGFRYCRSPQRRGATCRTCPLR